MIVRINRAFCLILAWGTFLGAIAFLIAAVWGDTDRQRLAATAAILGAAACIFGVAASYLGDVIAKQDRERHREMDLLDERGMED